jgi:tetratricopeptide (TPR) repeat protein
MKNKPIFAALALAALFFAILLPPEAYGDGKLAVILCGSFAFFASLSERRISPAYIYGGVLGFAYLLFHALFISMDVYRSLEFTSVIWAYYCLFGFFRYADFDPAKPFAVCMVALCLIVSGYGLYQYFWGFDQLYNYVFYAASDQVLKVPALTRIAAKRVSSTLALPGTLWGFLVIALPLHVALWKEQWKRANLVRAILIASCAMLLLTGFLTRSFGFLVGLFTLAAVWGVRKYRRFAWNKLAAVLIILAILGGMFYSARRSVIESSNPMSLRFKNWISAWSIFSANPMGSGLNTYGVLYSRYMLPNSNETQYTHNTALQLLAELGYPALIAAAVLVLLAVRAKRRGDFKSVSPYLLAALSVWIAHNLIDIDVYFPSVGVVGAVLLGIILRKPSAEPQPVARGAMVTLSVAGVAFLLFAGFAMVSSELQVRSQIEFGENRFEVAAETLKNAATLMPINSSILHDQGEVNLNLFQRRHDSRYLDTAIASFRREIELSPAKAGGHTGLGLCLSSAGRLEEAVDEIRIAESLYPSDANLQSVSRLMGRRLAGLPIK